MRRAEELSQSAANALLKTLEEPGDGTHFILLSSQPDTLLPTIRSRTQRVRFAPLPDEIVAKLLAERGFDASRAAETARIAGGSMETAMALANPDETAKREAFVARALEALDAPDLGGALELAEEAKKGSRDTLAIHIYAMAAALADRARAATEGETLDSRIDSATARYRLALAAPLQLDANASAQLVVESMLARMRSAH